MNATPQPGPEATPRDEEVARLVAGTLRSLPDFPKPGVVFKDFAPVFADPRVMRTLVQHLARRYAGRVDRVAGVEARGFVLGAMLAYELGVGFVPVRKQGKLPGDTVAASYDLEYGSATIEVQRDAFPPGARVVVVDDVLATGGTAAAACELVERVGAQVVALDVVLELAFLGGRSRLAGRRVEALVVEH